MPRLKAPFAIAGVLLMSGAAALALTQPETAKSQPAPDKPKPEGTVDPEAAPDAAINPGPVHEKLMKLAGSWETSTSMEMQGIPPSKTAGTVTINASLDGRFLQESGAGEMMGVPTKDFKMWGYNGASKKYEGIWAWTMSTGFLYLKGNSTDNGKTVDWDAWFDNESGEREELKVRTMFVDEDHFTVKLFAGTMPDGSPGPVMVTEYSRRKP